MSSLFPAETFVMVKSPASTPSSVHVRVVEASMSVAPKRPMTSVFAVPSGLLMELGPCVIVGASLTLVTVMVTAMLMRSYVSPREPSLTLTATL